MAPSLGIAEPFIICCQQGDWHNRTKNTLWAVRDLGAFLKHVMNEAIRVNTLCTKQELWSGLEKTVVGEVLIMCLIAGSSMLASLWSKMLVQLCFFWVRKPSSPAEAELLAGVNSKECSQIFCCVGFWWGDLMNPSLFLKQGL